MIKFHGRSLNTVDEKRRVILPSEMRKQLPDSFYITIHKDKPIILIYPEEEFDTKLKIEEEKNYNSDDSDDAIRALVQNAESVRCDKIGRIVIPEYLFEIIKNPTQVYVCGTLRHIEIWAKDHYDETFKR